MQLAVAIQFRRCQVLRRLPRGGNQSHSGRTAGPVACLRSYRSEFFLIRGSVNIEHLRSIDFPYWQ
jgi:hypothetical protein